MDLEFLNLYMVEYFVFVSDSNLSEDLQPMISNEIIMKIDVFIALHITSKYLQIYTSFSNF